MVLFLGGIMGEQYTIAERMKQLRNITGFNRAEFARQQGIPLRNIAEILITEKKNAGICIASFSL